jgi:hypothetical protein
MMSRRFGPVLAALLIAGPARGHDPAADVTEPPAFAEFLIVPLRVHVLTSDDLPAADCKLKDDDLARILGKVNRIWQNAGVHFGLEAIVREPAARVEEVRPPVEGGATPLSRFRRLIPEKSRGAEGVDVYYIHRFPVNGVYFGDRTALVQETAALRPVPGGSDEPIPRVTAHELGHALGLAHRQDRTNLLASGTTGTSLNGAEVQQARAHARRLPGTRAVAEVRRAAVEAETAGDRATARRLWTWLGALPGADAAEVRQRLAPLVDGPPS